MVLGLNSPYEDTRVPLPPAFKFEVGPIWPHFAVLISEAAETPGRVVLAPSRHGHGHVDD